MCANKFYKWMTANLLALTLCLLLSVGAIAAPVADLTPTAEPPTPTVEAPTSTPEPTLTPVPPTETPVVVPTETPFPPTATPVPPTPTSVVVDNPDDDGEDDHAPAPTWTPVPVEPTPTNTPPPTPSTMPVTGGGDDFDGLWSILGLLAMLSSLVAVGRFYEHRRSSGY